MGRTEIISSSVNYITAKHTGTDRREGAKEARKRERAEEWGLIWR